MPGQVWDRGAAWLAAMFLGVVCLAASLAAGAAVIKDFSWFTLPATFAWLGLAALIVKDSHSTAPRWSLVAFVVLVSLGLRLWSLELLEGVAISSDPMNYSNLARSVMAGNGLMVSDWQYGPDLRALFPPLYPLAMAGFWSIFGESAHSTLALNLIFDLATAWLLFDIGRGMGQPQAGRIAALLYALYPALMLSAGTPQKESLMLMLMALILRSLLAWDRERQVGWPVRHAAMIGLCWGLLSLVQPAVSLVPLALALAMMARHGFAPVFRAGLIASAVFLCVMMPWWVRNWMLFDRFVPFTTAAGFAFNLSLLENRLALPPEVMALPEAERSGAMAKLVMARIGEVPVDYVKGVITAVIRAFGYEEAAVAQYRHTTPPIGPEAKAWLTATLQILYATMAGLAAAGFWRLRRMNEGQPLAMLYLAALACICLSNIWFEFAERHRHVTTPIIMMMAAYWLATRTMARGNR